MTHGPSCRNCENGHHEICGLRGCYCHCAGAYVEADLRDEEDKTVVLGSALKKSVDGPSSFIEVLDELDGVLKVANTEA